MLIVINSKIFNPFSFIFGILSIFTQPHNFILDFQCFSHGNFLLRIFMALLMHFHQDLLLQNSIPSLYFKKPLLNKLNLILQTLVFFFNSLIVTFKVSSRLYCKLFLFMGQLIIFSLKFMTLKSQLFYFCAKGFLLVREFCLIWIRCSLLTFSILKFEIFYFHFICNSLFFMLGSHRKEDFLKLLYLTIFFYF